jgi:uncharacterized protein (TIGR00730 family)
MAWAGRRGGIKKVGTYVNAPIVTVFGSSRAQPGDAAYVQAHLLGGKLAEAGFRVATGGYIGTMEAVSKGTALSGGHVIGVTCDQIESWRPVEPNHWVQEEIRLPTLRERVYRLIEIGQALIALPGGLGTLSEVALAWSLLQTGEIDPKPLVLIGELWQKTLQTFLDLAGDYVAPKDAGMLLFTDHVDAAIQYVRDQLHYA